MASELKLIPWDSLRCNTYLLIEDDEKIHSLPSQNFSTCLIEPFQGSQKSNYIRFLYDNTTKEILYGPQHDISTLVFIKNTSSSSQHDNIVFLRSGTDIHYVLTNALNFKPQYEIKAIFVHVNNSSQIDRKNEDNSYTYVYINLNDDKEIIDVWSSKVFCCYSDSGFWKLDGGNLDPLKFQTYIVHRIEKYNPINNFSLLHISNLRISHNMD